MLNFSLPTLVSHFILKKFSLGLFFFSFCFEKVCVWGGGGEGGQGGGGGGEGGY